MNRSITFSSSLLSKRLSSSFKFLSSSSSQQQFTRNYTLLSSYHHQSILTKSYYNKYNFSTTANEYSSSSSLPARDSMDYDVLIVGAGPAGLSAAIKLKQLAIKNNKEISICVIEKGAEVGSHILSGNVFDPKALNELIPNWKEKGAPITTAVTDDKVMFLTEKYAFPTPIPPTLHNHGNYIISLGALTKWLGKEAEELGVEIFPGFSGSEVLYNDVGAVCGVATCDVGIAKDGSLTENFQRGMELRAKQTIFSEGVRGSLSESVMEKFNLRSECDPQTYGLGLKEVWEIDPKKHREGLVMHTVGWPAPTDLWCGSFLYHAADNKVFLGVVVGLDYANPYVSPYQTFQQWKQHPHIRKYLEGGKCLSYGARCINEGGYQSIPKLTFKGGVLIGCSAGFLNVPRIKGAHTAMKSGLVAAEAIYAQHVKDIDLTSLEVVEYEKSMRASWVFSELKAVRNYHPSFHYGGLFSFLLYSAFEAYIARGNVPWTFRNKLEDYQRTKKASESKQITYPKADGVISFDLLTNLQRSGVRHNELQQSHLRIKPELSYIPETISYQVYAAPETRFCPAKVYEYVTDEQTQKPKLIINNTNCVHCKSCDIKTPGKYINWTVPEGGGGPNYENM